MSGECRMHEQMRMCTSLWSDNMKKRDNLGELDVDGKNKLRCISQKERVRVWTGLNWLDLRSDGDL